MHGWERLHVCPFQSWGNSLHTVSSGNNASAPKKKNTTTLGGVFCSSRCVVRSTWVSPSDHGLCNLAQHTVYWTLSHSSLQISNYEDVNSLGAHLRAQVLRAVRHFQGLLLMKRCVASIQCVSICFDSSNKECTCHARVHWSSATLSCFNLGWHRLRHRLPRSVHQSSWYTTGPTPSPWIIPCV